MMGRSVLGLLAVLALCGTARASDFFVITDTFKLQQDAQMRAAAVGGWTLDTDLYSGLGPGLFAVVRGPYASKAIADQALKQLKADSGFKAAYVKDAGSLRLPAALVKSVPPKVLAALLGELSITVTDMPGDGNPCAPQEPYQNVSVTLATIERTYDAKADKAGFRPQRVDVGLGGFWIIKRTGEIERMRICAE